MDLIREDLTERRLRFKSRQFHTAVTAVMAARYSHLPAVSLSCTSTPVFPHPLPLPHQPGTRPGAPPSPSSPAPPIILPSLSVYNSYLLDIY
ncbi:hypothetical protein E2C01_004894 [Portunus trituberculatus]|uniref:Uncharacterized protein n=1 Tax=Portunus trituberculatus TaxID=210409 RepID=A0A5B7CSJ8_PORTR|nr:hypothetical protein [Portunus trituberculatus]